MYWGRLYALYRFVARFHKKVLRRHTVQPRRYGLPAGRPWKPNWLACQGKPPLQRHGSRRYVLVLALVLALVPGVAYAATGSLSYDDMAVVWGPNYVTPRAGSGVIANGVLVCANSKYNAALVTLGISVTDSRLTHDVKAKLSNESTGGAFWTFAQLFDAYKQSDGLHYPPWGGLDNRMVDEYAYLIGDEWLYFGAYTDAQKASALEDLNAILDGGDIGGGGGSGGGVSGDTLNIDIPIAWLGSNYNSSISALNFSLDGTSYTNKLSINNVRLPKTITLSVPTNKLNIDLTSAQLIIGRAFTGSSRIRFVIYVLESGTFTKSTSTYTTTYNDVTYTSVVNGVTCTGTIKETSIDATNADFTYSNGTFTYVGSSTKNFSIYNLATLDLGGYSADGLNQNGYIGFAAGSSGTPPTNWPETPEPTTPTAPVVPAPGNVQITISSRPTFNFTWAPQTTITRTTTTYDNSQELRSIYDELVAFHLDSVTAYNSMILKLNTACQGITSLGTDIDNQFSWLFDNLHAVIDGNFLALKQYLRQLFEWLASQMDFTITGGGYNDATVVSWLKRIWSRLGSGINTRPNDPVANPGESVDWLGQFIETLLGGLGDVVSSLAADVLGLVDDVHDKFPFSIPWDALAAFTSLAAVPTTPHFTFDYVIAGSHVVYDIDLAPYNDLAALARSVFIYFWGFLLLMKTTWLLDILGGATNMIGNFAVQALGG